MQPVYGATGILAIGLIIAGLLIGGRYTVAPVSRGDFDGFVVVVDRFTGSVKTCSKASCGDFR
jgi:hypothetical protein